MIICVYILVYISMYISKYIGFNYSIIIFQFCCAMLLDLLKRICTCLLWSLQTNDLQACIILIQGRFVSLFIHSISLILLALTNCSKGKTTSEQWPSVENFVCFHNTDSWGPIDCIFPDLDFGIFDHGSHKSKFISLTRDIWEYICKHICQYICLICKHIWVHLRHKCKYIRLL